MLSRVFLANGYCFWELLSESIAQLFERKKWREKEMENTLESNFRKKLSNGEGPVMICLPSIALQYVSLFKFCSNYSPFFFISEKLKKYFNTQNKKKWTRYFFLICFKFFVSESTRYYRKYGKYRIFKI